MALNDILTTSEGDALVSDGDFVVGNSEMQHQQLLYIPRYAPYNNGLFHDMFQHQARPVPRQKNSH